MQPIWKIEFDESDMFNSPYAAPILRRQKILDAVKASGARLTGDSASGGKCKMKVLMPSPEAEAPFQGGVRDGVRSRCVRLDRGESIYSMQPVRHGIWRNGGEVCCQHCLNWDRRPLPVSRTSFSLLLPVTVCNECVNRAINSDDLKVTITEKPKIVCKTKRSQHNNQLRLAI